MAYSYIGVPQKVTYQEVLNNNSVMAPSKYTQFLPSNKDLFCPMSKLCIESKQKTKVINSQIYRYAEIGDINVNTGIVEDNHFYGIEVPSESPKKCQKGDILISTVRTYRGGFGMINSECKNFCCSPAILLIREVAPEITKEYLLAVLRTDFFIEQILGLQTRGMYPRLDGDAMDKVLIPVPKSDTTIKYVSYLMRAYLNKQELIKQRHAEIMRLIDEELNSNQKPNTFTYHLPKISEIENVGRLDASLYKAFYKQNLFKILNYSNGYKTLTDQQLDLIPGPSLELKLLETRIDSDTYIKGFYRLITPTQITNYGTIKYEHYIGTPTFIKKIQYGDILFGESGTGRTMVYLDSDNITINNAHAHILRSRLSNDLERIITIRSILQYYKESGITDCLTVGGSGGHLSPSYFDRICIPLFPGTKQKEIAKLYHNPQVYPTEQITLDKFLSIDDEYNAKAGIYELDKTAKHLQELLNNAIDDIVNDREVKISF